MAEIESGEGSFLFWMLGEGWNATLRFALTQLNQTWEEKELRGLDTNSQVLHHERAFFGNTPPERK